MKVLNKSLSLLLHCTLIFKFSGLNNDCNVTF